MLLASIRAGDAYCFPPTPRQFLPRRDIEQRSLRPNVAAGLKLQAAHDFCCRDLTANAGGTAATTIAFQGLRAGRMPRPRRTEVRTNEL